MNLELDLYDYVFARAERGLPEDLEWILAKRGGAGLSDMRKELLTSGAGALPGHPEAFADSASRDDALGQYGEYVKFVACSWGEAKAAGYKVSEIAIGHALHEPGFDRLAALVIDAVAQEMKDTGSSGTVFIARVEYGIDHRPGGDITVSALPQFGVDGDMEQMEATMAWLQREITKRLAIKTSV
jgi:hypothetical protein